MVWFKIYSNTKYGNLPISICTVDCLNLRMHFSLLMLLDFGVICFAIWSQTVQSTMKLNLSSELAKRQIGYFSPVHFHTISILTTKQILA